MSNNTEERETAKIMLPIIHNLRTHWSTVITTHIGYAVTMVTGIWAFFLKQYFSNGTKPEYLVTATIISSVFLILWRIYAHFLDNQIAGLYPDLVFYEGILSVPPEHGTSGYLIRTLPNIEKILQKSDMCPRQKSEALKHLVCKHRIGNRGHFVFDMSVFAYILIVSIVTLMICRIMPYILFIIILGFIVVACLLLYGLYCYFSFIQREPSGDVIDAAISKAEQKSDKNHSNSSCSKNTPNT